MNVTKTEAKCSQLPVDSSRKEGSMQTNSAENEGYAGVHNSGRITENNIADADQFTLCVIMIIIIVINTTLV